MEQHTSDQTGVPARPHDTRLHAGAVSVVGVTVQSVGLIGPAIGILLTTPFIVSLAGVSSGLAFLIGFLLMLAAAVPRRSCHANSHPLAATTPTFRGRSIRGWAS